MNKIQQGIISKNAVSKTVEQNTQVSSDQASCDLKIFQRLSQQSYTAVPDIILSELSAVQLSATDLLVFFHLWGAFQKNLNYFKEIKPVIISIAKIAAKICKSDHSVLNSLQRLEFLGWLKTDPRHDENTGSQIANCYWIMIPTRVKSKILVSPMRKKSQGNEEMAERCNKSASPEQREAQVLERPQEEASSDLSASAKQDNKQSNKSLFDLYLDNYQQYRKEGAGRISASQKALSDFSMEERLKILQLQAEDKKETSVADSKYDRQTTLNQSTPGCRILQGEGEGSFTPNNNINNIYYYYNKGPQAMDKSEAADVNDPCSNNLIVALKKNVKKTVTAALARQKQHGNIHAKVLQQKTMQDLAVEVSFHIENRPPSFTQLLGSDFFSRFLLTISGLLFDAIKVLSVPMVIYFFTKGRWLGAVFSSLMYTVLILVSVLSAVSVLKMSLNYNHSQALQNNLRHQIKQDEINLQKSKITTLLKNAERDAEIGYRERSRATINQVNQEEGRLKELQRELEAINNNSVLVPMLQHIPTSLIDFFIIFLGCLLELSISYLLYIFYIRQQGEFQSAPGCTPSSMASSSVKSKQVQDKNSTELQTGVQSAPQVIASAVAEQKEHKIAINAGELKVNSKPKLGALHLVVTNSELKVHSEFTPHSECTRTSVELACKLIKSGKLKPSSRELRAYFKIGSKLACGMLHKLFDSGVLIKSSCGYAVA